MDQQRLQAALSTILSAELAKDITSDFIKIRADCATATLERASSGKFVETFVQCLQYISTGTFDDKPDVDGYLSRHAENQAATPEGLRICGARLARGMYTLRNKRNIAHKNPVDPNRFDLRISHEAAAWIVAELLRNASAIPMEEAGKLIELIQAPVGSLVEEIDGHRIVHAKTTIEGEILILLHSHYPDYVEVEKIVATVVRDNKRSVTNALPKMVRAKKIFGDTERGYRLTTVGYKQALELIIKHME